MFFVRFAPDGLTPIVRGQMLYRAVPQHFNHAAFLDGTPLGPTRGDDSSTSAFEFHGDCPIRPTNSYNFAAKAYDVCRR